MGYLHIDNLYKNRDILLFKEYYALEKIHGTSAHITWKENRDLSFYAGGENYDRFVGLFDTLELGRVFTNEIAAGNITVYGEAYGGKQQGMSKTYGPDLKFVVFDVKIGDGWLTVPKAVDVCVKLELEFVHYRQVSTSLEALDAERDANSVQSVRNGVEGEHIREGVVLRPLIEVIKNNGARIICKHKRPEFRERKSIPEVDPAKRELMEKASEIADEWVTPMRMSHVLDKIGNPTSISDTRKVINAVVEDVCREADGLIADNNSVRKAIGRSAAKLFKEQIMTEFRSAK